MVGPLPSPAHSTLAPHNSAGQYALLPPAEGYVYIYIPRAGTPPRQLLLLGRTPSSPQFRSRCASALCYSIHSSAAGEKPAGARARRGRDLGGGGGRPARGPGCWLSLLPGDQRPAHVQLVESDQATPGGSAHRPYLETGSDGDVVVRWAAPSQSWGRAPARELVHSHAAGVLPLRADHTCNRTWPGPQVSVAPAWYMY